MKDKINTYVQFYLNNVELNLSVKDDLKRQDDRLKNFGFILVSDGMKDSKECFWDGIDWFIKTVLVDDNYQEFRKDCREELKQANFKCKQTYKDIKKLLKRAQKLNLITIQ